MIRKIAITLSSFLCSAIGAQSGDILDDVSFPKTREFSPDSFLIHAVRNQDDATTSKLQVVCQYGKTQSAKLKGYVLQHDTENGVVFSLSEGEVRFEFRMPCVHGSPLLIFHNFVGPVYLEATCGVKKPIGRYARAWMEASEAGIHANLKPRDDHGTLVWDTLQAGLDSKQLRGGLEMTVGCFEAYQEGPYATRQHVFKAINPDSIEPTAAPTHESLLTPDNTSPSGECTPQPIEGCSFKVPCGYVYYRQRVYYGFDLGRHTVTSESDVESLVSLCDSLDGCQSFNTEGWYKREVAPLSVWNSVSKSCTGTFVKKAFVADEASGSSK